SFQEKVEPDLKSVRVAMGAFDEVQVAVLSEVRKISSDRRLARELLDLSPSWTRQQVPLLPERVAEDVGVEHVIGLKDLRLRQACALETRKQRLEITKTRQADRQWR